MHKEEIKYPFFLEIRLKPKDIDYSKILLNWTKIIYFFNNSIMEKSKLTLYAFNKDGTVKIN